MIPELVYLGGKYGSPRFRGRGPKLHILILAALIVTVIWLRIRGV